MFLGSEMRADAICLGQQGKDPNVGDGSDGSDGRNAYSMHDRISFLQQSLCTFPHSYLSLFLFSSFFFISVVFI